MKAILKLTDGKNQSVETNIGKTSNYKCNTGAGKWVCACVKAGLKLANGKKSKCKDKYLQILGNKIIYKGNIGAGYAQV